MKARKEYKCDVCGFPIHKGEEYIQMANEDDMMETATGCKPKPFAKIYRAHEICWEIVCDGYECDDDFDYTVTEALESVGYKIENGDWKEAIKTQNITVSKKPVEDFVNFIKKKVNEE